MARLKYFPHLAGSLVLASAATLGMLDKWEPKKGDSDAHLVVYADKLAQGLPTVCNGITKHVSTIPVIVGEKWTQEMCDQQQEQAIEKVQLQLAMCFKKLPPQSVFDSAFDHAWNNGVWATCGSESMKTWNNARWIEGCRLLAFTPTGNPNWASVKTGKILPNGKPEYKFVQGLHNRGIDRVNDCIKGINNAN
jgi:GH24 family phage-related lysozyme (muramidase)